MGNKESRASDIDAHAISYSASDNSSSVLCAALRQSSVVLGHSNQDISHTLTRSGNNIISEPDRCVHPHNINTDSGVPASSGVEHIFAATARENTHSRASQLGTQAMSLQRQTTLLRCAAISLHRLVKTPRQTLRQTPRQYFSSVLCNFTSAARL